MAERLRLRFQQGDVIVDLEGDATSVKAEFAALKTAGYGLRKPRRSRH
jgi:hypothetical protein